MNVSNVNNFSNIQNHPCIVCILHFETNSNAVILRGPNWLFLLNVEAPISRRHEATRHVVSAL